jgi:hypothetical protein
MRIAPFLLAVMLSLAGPVVIASSASRSPGHDVGCEPGGPVDLHARVISRAEHGPNTTVTVEVIVFSYVDLPGVRIRGAFAGGTGPGRASDIPETLTSIPAKAHQRFLYQLDLERGRNHGLFFRATPEDPSLKNLEGSAFLRVNLDPDKMPERKGNLVQYRARMGAR